MGGEGEEGTNAIECEGDFVWDVVTGSDKAGMVKNVKSEEVVKGKKKPKKEKEKVQVEEKSGQSDNRDSDSLLPTVNPSSIDKQADVEAEEQPFQLKNLKLTIPKGAFVAIVGRIGSGKVSGNI